MSLSLSLSQKTVLEQSYVISLPSINWSLVNAFEEDSQHRFTFPLTIKRYKLENFDALDHEARMKLVEEVNEIFRFVYTRGRNERTGKENGYFKIPLVRDYNIRIDDIKIRISRTEYKRATAIIENVGQMERIARAIPYHTLLTNISEHLAKEYNVPIADTVIVGVDRGGDEYHLRND